MLLVYQMAAYVRVSRKRLLIDRRRHHLEMKLKNCKKLNRKCLQLFHKVHSKILEVWPLCEMNLWWDYVLARKVVFYQANFPHNSVSPEFVHLVRKTQCQAKKPTITMVHSRAHIYLYHLVGNLSTILHLLMHIFSTFTNNQHHHLMKTNCLPVRNPKGFSALILASQVTVA